MGVDPSTIDPHQTLTSLGMDSIKAAEFQSYVEDRYQCTIHMEDLFEGLTLAAIAHRVDNRVTNIAAASEPTRAHQPTAINRVMHNRYAMPHRQRGGVLQKAKDFDLTQRLDEIDLLPFYRQLTRNEGATCVYRGRTLVMLGSNNYLGLTADSRVREAAAEAARLDGPSLTGSRLLNGSTPAQSDLERGLAAFLGRQDALLFTTGYQANIGLLSAIMGDGTTLVADDECHASIYDGAAVGRCRVIQFRHNDVADLDRRLTDELGETPGMVMVDGVYSMSGDLAPLDEIRDVCTRHGVPLAVDDAHGLGMVGKTGRGIEEEIGDGRCADILTGTFSKSLASIGGWVAGDKYLVEWIRYHGRPMLFSAAIPPPAVAAAAAALNILISEPWRIQRIQEQAAYWRAGLMRLGFNVGRSRTAIVPVITGDEMTCIRFSKGLLDAGVYTNCVVAPATPPNRALIRTSITAIHEKHHLDTALEIFEAVGYAHGIIQ
ncbi:MAG: aminotransferase class I/II-fold pyridoxal phosphate-dependent enzyme [Pseudonocardiaceae bacterium]